MFMFSLTFSIIAVLIFNGCRYAARKGDDVRARRSNRSAQTESYDELRLQWESMQSARSSGDMIAFNDHWNVLSPQLTA